MDVRIIRNAAITSPYPGHELIFETETVEHPVASIYSKIGASGRTARAAATAYALRTWVRE